MDNILRMAKWYTAEEEYDCSIMCYITNRIVNIKTLFKKNCI